MSSAVRRSDSRPNPFDVLGEEWGRRDPLRAAITAATRRPEEECVRALLDGAASQEAEAAAVSATARRLVEALRAKSRPGGVEGLIQEYALSSQEGVALMCLAEALLRIPDAGTRDALIRDKVGGGDWQSHLGHSPSLFVNAATWGLLVTGRLTATASESGLSAALRRLIARGGEPIIRKGTDLAMRMMGEQFVTGQTIAEALARARPMEARGFRYSYDMLGEAATTAADAARYLAAYRDAIEAIGEAAAGRGPYEGPGISIKLSALHPRYARAQAGRAMSELLPRVQELARIARCHDIGLNIDAEEADRLELSLDILEALALDPDLSGWNGIGFVIQAYGRRCPFVVDWLVDLGRRSGRRLMVRLVKGAYWDSEIKKAQVDGLEDFPVFTRKPHTDVSYLACARKLLAAPDAVFPQFATHNAQTLAAILHMAGPDCPRERYEFQCLHGMGEPLYDEVVGAGGLDRPCRVYAPVGTHETLLAYLVRRLLENGANSSFVNRIADPQVAVADLVADPVARVRAEPVPGAPNERIRAPRRLFGGSRENSAGLDLADEDRLRDLDAALAESLRTDWTACAGSGSATPATSGWVPVLNPADGRDTVGHVRPASPDEVGRALAQAAAAAPGWAARSVGERAEVLRRAADALEGRMGVLIGLVVREAGKSIPNAVAEIREAVDFLRYYADEAERLGDGHLPLGPVACISPWNFPLAIFTGQVAAALAAGNPVLAKPAEETPLVAAEAVRILHAAGIGDDVVQLVPGNGDVGAALVADLRVQAVMFTGSDAVARLIQRRLAERPTPAGRPVPLVAETGGQNAMVVDSSALAEQVVADVIASAFDSAGQRCSALRILCLQEDVADRILLMLRGAMDELSLGNPGRLSVDVGPVITAEAQAGIEAHVAAMSGRGRRVSRLPLGPQTACGTFVAPTLIEIERIGDVEREVFGPVLHVLRFRREDLEGLLRDINATGYGLTFGLHTRIDETVARVVERIEAGNIYVNRNIIGASVGVQPFGGSGLSGTGPKAGGPLYLARLLADPPAAACPDGVTGAVPPVARAYANWLRAAGHADVAERVGRYLAGTRLGGSVELSGPVGERNVYGLRPRGEVGALAGTADELQAQVGAILATGNVARVQAGALASTALAGLPREVQAGVRLVDALQDVAGLRAVLFAGDRARLLALGRAMAAREGAIVPVLTPSEAGDYDLDRLLEERAVSTNTAAAGGNASLMSLG